MEIKSYRAATLREALLQIKEELGEDALVIETKQVRAGGFMGVGARNLIEVRVAPNATPAPAAARAQAAPAAKSKAPKTNAKLDLREDSAAAPEQIPIAPARPTSNAKVDEQRALGAFAALAARAYANQNGASTPPPREPRRQGIELAESAPRIVHRRPAADVPRKSQHEAAPKAAGGSAANKAEPVPSNTVSAELARLRAEMREMKFALGKLSTQPAPRRAAQATADFDGEPALYDSPHYETFLELRNAGIAPELAKQAVRKALKLGQRETREAGARACAVLAAALPAWVRFAEAALALQAAAVFIGPTGVGKTTTIAKLAAHIALRARRRVELITLDTYRIAAIQQLKTYAEIIGAGCHVAHSVVELDALTQRFAKTATVLVDTAGRSPHDLADQFELADYLRGNRALLKCLVLPATTQPDDAQLALEKFALFGANRLVLTKLDETVQPGTLLNVAGLGQLPLMYLCCGQRVPEDLERATPVSFAQRLLRARTLAKAA
jgi:flagellar biosynthesis protein FlhF